MLSSFEYRICAMRKTENRNTFLYFNIDVRIDFTGGNFPSEQNYVNLSFILFNAMTQCKSYNRYFFLWNDIT